MLRSEWWLVVLAGCFGWLFLSARNAANPSPPLLGRMPAFLVGARLWPAVSASFFGHAVLGGCMASLSLSKKRGECRNVARVEARNFHWGARGKRLSGSLSLAFALPNP